MDLTEEQWEILEPVFRHKERTPGKAGRPPREPRGMVEAALWVLRTGAPWADLPRGYPPYQTCHRWFQSWSKDGTLKQRLRPASSGPHHLKTPIALNSYLLR